MLRSIQVDDIDTIIDALLTLRKESPRYSVVTPDVEYVRGTLTNMIQLPSFIGTIDANGRGFMFGMATQTWFNPVKDAYEQLLYILPTARGGLLAARLIREFEYRARDLGCWHVRAGVTTEMQTEQALRLYERLGYTRNGNTISKRII